MHDFATDTPLKDHLTNGIMVSLSNTADMASQKAVGACDDGYEGHALRRQYAKHDSSMCAAKSKALFQCQRCRQIHAADYASSSVLQMIRYR